MSISSRPAVFSRFALSGIIAATAAVLLSITPDLASAQSAIGTVQKAFGKAAIVRSVSGEESVVPATVGSEIFMGDALSTGENGGIGVIFEDNTVFSIGTGSQVVIDEFIYNPRGGEGSFVASALTGSFKYLSGGISKVNRDGVRLRLPVATMGVRGTHFAATIPPAGSVPTGMKLGIMQGRELLGWHTNNNDFATSQSAETMFDGSYVVPLFPDPSGLVGQVAVATEAGEVLLSSANSSTMISSANAPPSAPIGTSSRTLGRLYAGAFRATPTRAEGFPESYTMFFNTGSAGFSSQTQSALAAVVQELRGRIDPKIRIAGHTDRQGDDGENLRLSAQRTAAVRQALLNAGVPEGIMTTVFYGEGEPLFPTADGVDEPRNRRVEVTVR